VQFGDLPLQLIAEHALFISMAKFARSLVTCHCSLVSCHCSLVSCHCSLVSCHCSLVSCHCSLVSCHCSLVSCHCSLINVSPRTTRTTTKQNLDPRFSYVQTRVKRVHPKVAILSDSFFLTLQLFLNDIELRPQRSQKDIPYHFKKCMVC
jgi:hypothetical protein